MLDEICDDFQEQEEARHQIVRATLESAFAITPDEAGEMGRQLGLRLGKQLLLKTDENPDLLGGCRVQVGDTVYDFSLSAQLRMIRQTMIAG